VQTVVHPSGTPGRCGDGVERAFDVGIGEILLEKVAPHRIVPGKPFALSVHVHLAPDSLQVAARVDAAPDLFLNRAEEIPDLIEIGLPPLPFTYS
jgi:hypothetical protein